MKRVFLALTLLLTIGAMPAQARDLQVVASFTVLADMVKQVGGTHVRVRSLVGPNGDPHVYEPTPQDAEALAEADLVFTSGLGLEGWMDRLVTASGARAPVIVASSGIRTLRMTEDGRVIPDPHAWNSALNGIVYAGNIARALAGADPPHAADYRLSAVRYEAELRQLDAWARQQVNAIPVDKRKVITSHDAFGYLGAAYGIDFHAPVGFSTEAEASATSVSALIDQMKREKIHAVFLENSNDSRLIRQIAAATGATPGGTLYAEALSGPDGPAPTYVRMLRYDIETLLAGMRIN